MMIKRYRKSAQVLTPPDLNFTASEDWKANHLYAAYFDPSTVVTRNVKSEIVSRYGDDFWDYTAHSMDGTSTQTLYFWTAPKQASDGILSKRIYEQHKALLFVIGERDDINAFGTLKRINSVAKEFCSRAYQLGVDLFSLLTDLQAVSEIFDSMNTNELTATSTLIQTLWRDRGRLPNNCTKIQKDKLINKIRAAHASLPERKQTPLIPSGIYCSILAGLIEGLTEIEQHIPLLLSALRKSIEVNEEIKKSLPHATKQQFAVARGIALAETAERLRSIGWSESPSKSLYSFIQGKISNYQTHLMHTVAAFSGMRFGETKILPLNEVLEIFNHRGQSHYLIKGYTHKLQRGEKKRTEWITIDQGWRAIEIASSIGQTILSLYASEKQEGQEALLFPSLLNPYRMMSTTAFLKGQKRLIETLSPLITNKDLAELDELELDRGWDRDGIQLGKRWPLAMHQLRRSLSVYAHRSGMVSLPALKAQLQHITDEMRAYYSDGWSRAVNLVFDSEHFSHEWNAAKLESSYFGMTGALRVAFDEEDALLGIGAERLAQVVSGRSRLETLALVKNGVIAYRETVLGGCVSSEDCKAMPLTPIHFDCVESNCANAVVRRKRLDLVIHSQENVVALLACNDPASVEHRLEAEHLKRMLLAKKQLEQRLIKTETNT